MQRPWNIPDLPVYSLATCQGDRVNMNICTYVTAISMKPKLYAVAVYEGTLTLNNMLQQELAVLQLLHRSQFGLVRHLGKKSGFDYNKHHYLAKNHLLTSWNGHCVLNHCSALMLLHKTDHSKTGDHHLFTFSVVKHASLDPDYLTTSLLQEKKIIRI